MNSFERYYIDQAGNGIAGFSGVKYQKGFGFFGRLLSGAVLPFLKFLGKNALSTGASIAQDLSDTNDFTMENIKNVSLKRSKETGKRMLKRASEKILHGEGIKRRRRKSIKKVVVKVLKKRKRKTKKVSTKKRVYKRKSKKVKTFKKKSSRKILKANDFL